MFKINLKSFLKDIIRGQKDQQPDWQLVGLVGILTIFGLIMLSSAGVASGFENFGNSYYHVIHQIIYGLLPGLFLFVIFSRLDYYRLKELAVPLLIATIVLLVLVFIPGIGSEHNTVAKSWISVLGISLQPSEIVKLTFLIYLAAWLAGRGEAIKDLRHGFLPFVTVLAIVTLLIILEPDFGTMSVIAIVSLLVYFVAGGSLRHLAWLTAASLGGLALMIKMSPYRAARLTTFLHPELDPKGIGYHINQALLAVGSGGFFGRGFGHSRQKFAYLPQVTGDSIFAVIGEELGFIISVVVIIAFILLILRGLKLANRCRDPFGRYLVAGIIIWFVAQAFLNIGAIIGLLPLTGVPLPFISYGGTALMTCLAAAGILVNISKQADND